jgi:hypothetical protein
VKSRLRCPGPSGPTPAGREIVQFPAAGSTSATTTVPAFAEDFAPDAKFFSQRKDGLIPAHLIRACRVQFKGRPKPWPDRRHPGREIPAGMAGPSAPNNELRLNAMTRP